MTTDYPKLRFVEAVPLQAGNEIRSRANNDAAFILRDPSGIAEGALAVSAEALFVLQFFDGNHSLLDIRTEFYRAFGVFLPEQRLTHLVAELERAYLLEGEFFQDYLRQLQQQMLAQPVRQAAHAGASYPADPKLLRETLDGYYRSSQGAGLPNRQLPDATTKPRVLAAVAPHIDLRAGGPCYTFTYRALAESEPAEVYVILGTGHSGLINCFSCLPKDFATPLGVVKHDVEFIEALRRRHPHDLLGEPLPHRSEHTIEFQTVFLQHLFSGKMNFTIVPILCSYAYLMLTDDRFSREKRIIEDFTKALRATIAASRRRVCVIASVDLSHVGPRYGEAQTPDAAFMQRVNEADRRLLSCIEAVNAEAFVNANAQIEDRYRLCGFAPLHTMLASTGAKRGRTLKYDGAFVDDRRSMVTFASAVLY
ncbi:MAG: AmmeMemoRadiSam system protein B [candidate division KSB1 bacterium]|nr:AmmeMemoRadiSam system protein B [candidate division KSB1 bacterium]MDZ7366629.1 AmmeMemoRadiSam system protein B [candidate division KSB1 bacterium]MDZ7404640.1 AmmeMemoRadiSam system protein B [candidate division KSB1 bacterium]